MTTQAQPGAHGKHVTREEVIKIAQIASIEIREEEIDSLVHEMRAVLNYVSVLQDVIKKYEKLGEAQPVRSVNVMRPDTAHDYDSSILLKAAPESEENYFVVPIIIKQ